MDFGLLPLFRRIEGYLQTQPLKVVVELAVIWIVVYMILRFLRGTRGARVIKGLAVILILATLAVQVLGGGQTFERLHYLYTNLLAFISLMLVVVFQPELRRALVRLGEANFFKQSGLRKAQMIDQVLGSVDYLARNKIGALIAIERQVGLGGLVEMGTRMDAEVSQELLNTIFWPGSALHDMGVVIQADRIVAAGVQFPLSDGEQSPQELGSRHRAAVGLSQEADALVLVVSEETGIISLAERGELARNLTIRDLRAILTRSLGKIPILTRDDSSTNSDTVAPIGGKMSGKSGLSPGER